MQRIQTRKSAKFLVFFFLLITVISFTIKDFNDSNLIKNTGILAFYLLLILFVVFKKKVFSLQKEEKIVFVISLVAFALRLFFILTTKWNCIQHDVGSYQEFSGHSGYIYFLLKNKSLPNFDPTSVWQFYHPPVNYIISAIWMSLHGLLGFSIDEQFESVQMLIVFYSMICAYIEYKILKKLNFKGLQLYATYSLTVFTPIYILTSGYINNDQLSYVFILLIVFYSLKWIEDSSFKNIIPIALAFGFGMITKLSVATMAFPVGLVFIYKFIKCILSKKNIKKLILQYLVFAVISVPIGLSWALRCYIKYGMPLNYVPNLGIDSWQFISGRSVLSRLLKIDIRTIFLHTDNFIEYNCNAGLLKTWLFDELNFSTSNFSFLCNVLFYLHLAIVAVSAICFLKNFIQTIRKKDKTFVFLILTLSLLLLFYYIFCFKYPHMCTMNIRYILILPFFSYIFLFSNYSNNKNAAKIIKISSSFLYCLFSFLLVFLVF